MQTDATSPMSGPTVHRGKDTVHKTFNLETMCNSCGPSFWSSFWPQQCWKSCADRFDHQPLLARAPSPDRIESTVQTDLNSATNADCRLEGKRGKHCCKMLQQFPYPYTRCLNDLNFRDRESVKAFHNKVFLVCL